MSTEFRATCKKRTSSDAKSPNPTVPEGDHRKRRRNRTTQSCLNCHTSKRMCDRKRPCGRCTQLGLTGLCVYEVDDPSQRSNAQDESSRLRQRVAELEGVIRELKNKPHPRWAKSGSSSDKEFDKCHVRTRSRSASTESVVEARHQSVVSQPPTNPNADSKEDSTQKQTACLVTDDAFQPDYLPSSFSSPFMGSASLSSLACSPFDMHSPPSAPSTGIVTPTEGHPQVQVTVAGNQQLTNDIDLSSLLMSYPELLACDEGPGHVDRVFRANTHNQLVDPRSAKYHQAQFLDGHCGCLNEAAGYNVVLELSLRLRKAADILSHSAKHRFNNGCPLNQKVVDLDVFATTALGNVTTSPNEFGTMHLRSRANTAPVPPAFSASNYIPPVRAPAFSSPSLRDLRSWSRLSCTADPPTSCDESFMTWEPHTGFKS